MRSKKSMHYLLSALWLAKHALESCNLLQASTFFQMLVSAQAKQLNEECVTMGKSRNRTRAPRRHTTERTRPPAPTRSIGTKKQHVYPTHSIGHTLSDDDERLS
jgi:hypothetical protein